MEEQRELEFHDTVPLPLEQLEKGRKRAVRQKDVILKLFRAHPHTWFTPYEIQAMYQVNFGPILITSVRRSITDLTKEPVGGRLIKGSRDYQVQERFKTNNNRWKYNTEYIAPLNPKK